MKEKQKVKHKRNADCIHKGIVGENSLTSYGIVNNNILEVNTFVVNLNKSDLEEFSALINS